MAGLSISKAWEETRRVVASEGRLLVSVALTLLVLPQTAFGTFFPFPSPDQASIVMLGVLLLVLTALAGNIAVTRLAIPPTTTVGTAMGRALIRAPILFVSFLIVMLGVFLVLIPVTMVLAVAGVWNLPPPGTPPSIGMIFLVGLVVALIFAVFQLAGPIAAAESGGPVRLISRSWQLARHQYWRLLVFMLLVIVGLIVVWLSGQIITGIATSVVLGAPEPASFSALIGSFVVAVLQSAFSVVMAVMLARIYVQLSGAGAAEASVPTSGS